MTDDQKGYLQALSDLRSWHRWQIGVRLGNVRAMQAPEDAIAWIDLPIATRIVPDRVGTEAIGEPVPNEARVPSPARGRDTGAAGETEHAVLPDRCNTIGSGTKKQHATEDEE